MQAPYALDEMDAFPRLAWQVEIHDHDIARDFLQAFQEPYGGGLGMDDFEIRLVLQKGRHAKCNDGMVVQHGHADAVTWPGGQQIAPYGGFAGDKHLRGGGRRGGKAGSERHAFPCLQGARRPQARRGGLPVDKSGTLAAGRYAVYGGHSHISHSLDEK